MGSVSQKLIFSSYQLSFKAKQNFSLCLPNCNAGKTETMKEDG